MRCARVCPRHAVEVGNGFVFVDWERCDGCAKCVAECEPGALQLRAPRLHAVPADAAVALAAPRQRSADDPPAATRIPLRDVAPFVGRWRAWEVVVVLAGVLALFGLQEAVMGSHWMTTVVPLGAKPLMRAGVLTLYYALQLVLLAVIGLRKRGDLAGTFGLRRAPVLASVLGVAGLLVVTRVFALAYGIAVEGAGWPMPAGPSTNITQYFGRDAIGFALTVIMVVIVGPLFEEVVFRGVLLGALQDRYGGVVAIVASSALFAAFHMNAWMFVPVAVMGAACALLAIRTRSLLPAYALHLAYNGVAVFLAFVLLK
jgi:membrane protease YdiL (CAAX protease family)/ferredoxin